MTTTADLKPVAGIELGYAEANVRKPNRKDVLVMRLAPTATVAGVFTKNRFCAAPVQICKAHLEAARAGNAPFARCWSIPATPTQAPATLALPTPTRPARRWPLN